MFSRHIKLLRYSYSCLISNYCNFSAATIETDPIERDPAPFFFDKEVQRSLKILTTVDYKKVFRSRRDGHKLKPPQYKFLTNEQLEKAIEAAKVKAEKYLQMPPVVKQRLNPFVPLYKDPGLQSYDITKYVFTDITFGLKNRERFIVIREPNGTLRHATWQEHDRLVQTYFPRAGKEIQKPKMFEGEHLKSLLNCKRYEFILDRACVQFEPDDPNYQMVTQEVYEYINKEKDFEILRSTRHFGPMVFHLVWTSNIENLLCEMIESSQIKDAIVLICLYHKIHPATKSAIEECHDSLDDIKFIMHYARLDSSKRETIEKLLQSYKELQQEYEIVAEGIKRAHGVSETTQV